VPRIICVAAARPNFMKVKPVLAALERRHVEVDLVHTGQHYDEAMSDVFFEQLDLRKPDFHLGVGAGSHAEQTAGVMLAFEPLLRRLRPDVVVVVGDVNSTMATSLVTAKSDVRLAHVEAGLRSGDWSMPEEVNRVITDRVSDLLLAPSPDAVANLEQEGCDPARIHLVGNVMIDTLLANVDRARAEAPPSEFGLEEGGYGLVTLHRPSNVDDDGRLGALLGALGRIAEQVPLVFPVHPRARAAVDRVGLPQGIRPVPPLGYLEFVSLEASARLVITDSGGVQEETTVLGVPCLTVRETTERPITVTEGTNRVVGVEPERIVEAAMEVLDRGVEARRPALWDGHAADRIAEVLLAVPGAQPGVGRRSTRR
jgi:UDP-N-acetylglucosamine 2-epimerase (non-hydrolysing)